MKKYGLLLASLLLMFSVAGCGKDEDVATNNGNQQNNQSNTNNNQSNTNNNDDIDTVKIATCDLIEDYDGYSIQAMYSVTATGNVVDIIRTEERITSTDQATLNMFETNVKNTYSVFDDLEHYEYEVTKGSGYVLSKTDIDYRRIDMDEMLAANSEISIMLDSNKKVRYDLVIASYEQLGAVCFEG